MEDALYRDMENKVSQVGLKMISADDVSRILGASRISVELADGSIVTGGLARYHRMSDGYHLTVYTDDCAYGGVLVLMNDIVRVIDIVPIPKRPVYNRSRRREYNGTGEPCDAVRDRELELYGTRRRRRF